MRFQATTWLGVGPRTAGMSPSIAFYGLPLRIALPSGDGWETVMRAATSLDELPAVLRVEEAPAVLRIGCSAAANWPDSDER